MKKILSITLALSLVLCVPALAAGSTFVDVPADAWYHDPIYTAARLDLISGYGGGRFGPEDKVTYAQYATMLCNIMWSAEVKSYEDITKGQAWYMPYVLVCEDKGIFDSTIFSDCPDWTQANLPMTREAMAQMSYNFLAAAKVDMSMTQAEELLGIGRIKDYGTIDAGNKQAVVWCYVNGVLNGYSGGNFGPKDQLTRAQAATVLCQVYGRATGDVTGTGKPVTSNPPQTEVKKPADAIGGRYDTSKYTVPADSNKDGYITEAEVRTVLDQLMEEYPEGTPWGEDKYYSNVPIWGANGRACAAFAMMASDRIFGNLPKRIQRDAYAIRLGDTIKDTSPHWCIVRMLDPWPEKPASGSIFTLDGNIGGKIGHNGGNSFGETDSDIKSGGTTVYTRYPAE